MGQQQRIETAKEVFPLLRRVATGTIDDAALLVELDALQKKLPSVDFSEYRGMVAARVME